MASDCKEETVVGREEEEKWVSASRTCFCRLRLSSVVEQVARQCFAACVSPILSKRNVFRIHILSVSSVSLTVVEEDKVSRCRLAVSNSPISMSSPATLRPKSSNLFFQTSKAGLSFSVLAFCARVRHSEDKAYSPMIALLCISAVPST